MGSTHRRIGPADREPRDDRAIRRVVLSYIADVNKAVLVEIRMKGEAVQRGQIGMDLGEIERDPRSAFWQPGSSGNE